MITPKLKRLAKKRGLVTEKVCNGDPHHANPNPQDKNRNAELWGELQAEIERKLVAEAKKVGLKVRYPGLYPVFDDSEGRTYYL